MLIVERFYTRVGCLRWDRLFFCIRVANVNCLIINNSCFLEKIFAKNIVKNISKVLQVPKNVLPLHSLNETHSERAMKLTRNFRASEWASLLSRNERSRKCRVCETNAEIAQLVEHNLAKVGVASSSLVFRSL